MRKTIVIFGIIMAFILGTLVSAPSVAAVQGEPFVFMQEEIDAILLLIQGMQDQLDNIQVTWVNLLDKPPGFADDIDNDLLSEISGSCTTNQIAKWDGAQWVCADIGASIAPNILVLHYEQSDSVPVPSTIQLPNLIELAVWEIVKDSAFVYDDASTPLFDSSVFANIIGNVDIGWYKSSDTTFSPTGMSWDTIHEISASNFGFEVESNFIPQSSLSSQTNFIAFGTANPFNEGDGNVVKDFSGIVTIHLLPGQSLVRISLP